MNVSIQSSAASKANSKDDDTSSFFKVFAWSICIFMLTTPFYFALSGTSPEVTVVRDLATGRRPEGSALPVYLLRLATLSFAIILASPKLGGIVANLKQASALIAYGSWATLSLLWSDEFTSSFNSLVALWPLIIVSILANGAMSQRELVRAILYAGIITGLSSVFWALVMPSQGLHQWSDSGQSVHAGNWRGIFIHKNSLGQICALYFVTAIFAGANIVSRTTKLMAMMILFILIVLSGSASALAIIVVGPIVAFYLFYLNSFVRIIVGGGVLLLGVAVFAILEDMLALLGRDITLTGRTQIWAIAYDFIQEKFLIGYGFMTSYGQFANTASRTVNVFEPHNSYVDTTLGLGVVGLLLFLACLISAWRAALIRRYYGSADAAFALVGLSSAWAVGCFAESAAAPGWGDSCSWFPSMRYGHGGREIRRQLRCAQEPYPDLTVPLSLIECDPSWSPLFSQLAGSLRRAICHCTRSNFNDLEKCFTRFCT